jgi:hypothetical protein
MELGHRRAALVPEGVGLGKWERIMAWKTGDKCTPRIPSTM